MHPSGPSDTSQHTSQLSLTNSLNWSMSFQEITKTERTGTCLFWICFGSFAYDNVRHTVATQWLFAKWSLYYSWHNTKRAFIIVIISLPRRQLTGGGNPGITDYSACKRKCTYLRPERSGFNHLLGFLLVLYTSNTNSSSEPPFSHVLN